MNPLMFVKFIKEMPSKDTRVMLLLLLIMVFSQDEKIKTHISNNIKFRKETRQGMKDLNDNIKTNTNGINNISENVTKIEQQQQNMGKIVSGQGEHISALEERTRGR